MTTGNGTVSVIASRCSQISDTATREHQENEARRRSQHNGAARDVSGASTRETTLRTYRGNARYMSLSRATTMGHKLPSEVTNKTEFLEFMQNGDMFYEDKPRGVSPRTLCWKNGEVYERVGLRISESITPY